MRAWRRLVALWVLFGGLATGGTPAPPAPAPMPVRVSGPPPDCATAMGPRPDGSRIDWYIVCRFRPGENHSRCCYASREAARADLTAFRAAWRRAAR